MKKNFLFVTLILTFMLSVFVACKDNNDSSSDLGNGNSKYAILNDAYLQADFENALTEIAAEKSKMSALTKVEDWAGGSKYKFTYANKMTLYVYCNMTSTVDSINYGDEKIYYRGYESYNINNYVYDDSYEYTLVFASEDYVKLYLNYPSTAKFPASNSWSISRYNDIYMLSSWVKASNAFGVESQYNFTTGFYVTETETKCIYLNIAGKTKLNNINQYKPTIERKQVEPKYPNKNSNGNTDGINLVYGQLGTYGKNENDNGYSYIAYYVPSGRYTVINNGNMGTIFVSNDTDTRTYRFASGSMGETKEMVVPNGYYIELSMYTNITLIRIAENDNSSASSSSNTDDTENKSDNNSSNNIDASFSGELKYLLSDDKTSYTVIGYEGNDLIIKIPKMYENIPVKKIGKSAFKNSSLTEIVLPETMIEIGDSAFYGCTKLKRLIIPDSVITICNNAFSNCYNLESVEFGNNVLSIGDYAFSHCCDLATIRIPNSVKSIGNGAFYNCHSTSLEIGAGVICIGDFAFSFCNFMSVTIPSNVTAIGQYAFSACVSLTIVTFEDTSIWYKTDNSNDWANKLNGIEVNILEIDLTEFKSSYYWYKL